LISQSVAAPSLGAWMVPNSRCSLSPYKRTVAWTGRSMAPCAWDV
jgi:hypothetical protein